MTDRSAPFLGAPILSLACLPRAPGHRRGSQL